MSLDVALTLDNTQVEIGPQIWIREDGQTKSITREEWDERFPDREPTVIKSTCDGEIFSYNITHNLARMASKAGVYEALWKPDENDMNIAEELIAPLRDGLAKLQTDPDHYKQFNPENGWGNYEGLVQFVASYLVACEKYPEAKVFAWR